MAAPTPLPVPGGGRLEEAADHTQSIDELSTGRGVHVLCLGPSSGPGSWPEAEVVALVHPRPRLRRGHDPSRSGQRMADRHQLRQAAQQIEGRPELSGFARHTLLAREIGVELVERPAHDVVLKLEDERRPVDLRRAIDWPRGHRAQAREMAYQRQCIQTLLIDVSTALDEMAKASGFVAVRVASPRFGDGGAERPLLIERVFGTADHAFGRVRSNHAVR